MLFNEKIFIGKIRLWRAYSPRIVRGETDTDMHQNYPDKPWCQSCLPYNKRSYLVDALRLWVPTSGSKRHLVTASKKTNELSMNGDGLAVLFWSYGYARFDGPWNAEIIDRTAADHGQEHTALEMSFGIEALQN